MDVGPTILELADGRRAYARLATAAPEDFEAVNRQLHAGCSLDSRTARYHGGKRELTRREYASLTATDSGRSWLATVGGEVVAMVNVLRHRDDRGTPVPGQVELALLVRDDVQGLGLGSALARHAAAHAAAAGATVLWAHIHSTNRRMSAILRRLGAPSWRVTGPTCTVPVPLGETG